MKVILTHEVTGLGTAGDVVDVKDGYARNFLFRRGLATAWTKGGQKQVDAIAKGRQVREVKSLEEAQSIKGNLESKAVTVTAHAGTGGRLFGAVSTGDIADAVKAAGGPSLDKRKIEVPTPIKTTGTHSALVRLHPEVRMHEGAPRITDEGHRLIDVRIPWGNDIAVVVEKIRACAGVIDTGFFPTEATEAIIAGASGIERLKR